MSQASSKRPAKTSLPEDEPYVSKRIRRGTYAELAGVKIPHSLPHWNRTCRAKRKRLSVRCKSKATIGSAVCKFHGGAAHPKQRLLKYLAWCVLGGNAGDQAVYAHLAVYATVNHILKMNSSTDEQKLTAGLLILQAFEHLTVESE